MQMKLMSTYEDLKAYVEVQMRAIDYAIKGGQSGTYVTAAMEEIAACNRLVGTLGHHFQIEVADIPGMQ